MNTGTLHVCSQRGKKWVVAKDFMGVFTKNLIKAMFKLLRVCQSAWDNLRCHWTDCLEIWYLRIFFSRKFDQKIEVSLKPDKNNGYFTRRPMYIYNSISQNSSLNISDRGLRENQNTYFMFSNFYFARKSCRLWDNVENYVKSQTGSTHALRMLDN